MSNINFYSPVLNFLPEAVCSGNIVDTILVRVKKVRFPWALQAESSQLLMPFFGSLVLTLYVHEALLPLGDTCSAIVSGPKAKENGY